MNACNCVMCKLCGCCFSQQLQVGKKTTTVCHTDESVQRKYLVTFYFLIRHNLQIQQKVGQ